MWRHSGRLLILLSVAHTVFGLTTWATGMHGLLVPGQTFWLASDTVSTPNLSALVWFLFAGVPLFFWGWTVQYATTALGRPMPASIGVALTVLAIVCWPFWPISGFPVAAAIGILMLHWSRAYDETSKT